MLWSSFQIDWYIYGCAIGICIYYMQHYRTIVENNLTKLFFNNRKKLFMRTHINWTLILGFYKFGKNGMICNVCMEFWRKKMAHIIYLFDFVIWRQIINFKQKTKLFYYRPSSIKWNSNHSTIYWQVDMKSLTRPQDFTWIRQKDLYAIFAKT